MKPPAEPGLIVYAPPGKPWWSTDCPTAAAAYRCVCGATGTTGSRRGVAAVQELLADWEEHVECSPYRRTLAALNGSRTQDEAS